MSIILSLIRDLPYLIMPSDLQGWSGLLGWSVVLILVLWRNKHYQKPWDKTATATFIGLIIAVPITSLFLGAQLPNVRFTSITGLTPEQGGRVAILFSAIPWVFASGFLGPLSSIIPAILSGLIVALWDTHSLFTILEVGSLAVILSLFTRQQYRHTRHAILRQPILASALTSVLYPLIFLINTIFLSGGDLSQQINFAATNLFTASLAVGFPLWIAGLLAQVLKHFYPTAWGGQPPWKLAPSERSVVFRSLRNVTPVIIVTLIIFITIGWNIARNKTEQMLVSRMAKAVEASVESIPFFLDSGQNLILDISRLISIDSMSPNEIIDVLSEQMQSMPYFSQLFIIDRKGNSIGGYPDEYFITKISDPGEQAGIDLALKGFSNQVYVLPPAEGVPSVQLTFITAIKDDFGEVQGALIGRTNIQTNPFAAGIHRNLSSLGDIGGTGFLLDETNRIIYHPDPGRLMTNYPIELVQNRGYFDNFAPEGTRQMTYYQFAMGRPWSVVMTLPTRERQRLALSDAIPQLSIVILASAAALVVVMIGLRMITSALKSLALETDRIVGGDVSHSMHSEEHDEIGRLRSSIEQMRLSLKTRLDELNRHLAVSKGIITSTDMEEAVRPILETGLSMGASSARILISPAAIPDTGYKTQSRFGLGRLSHNYKNLDDQLLGLMANQDRIILPNASRTTLLSYKKGIVYPGALMALALRHENQYYGVFWIAYKQEHLFSQEEVRFLATLAGQSMLAILNNHLFSSSEIGHQHFAAILASIPDPVFVTDQQERLVLANPVAKDVFEVDLGVKIGQQIEEVIDQQDFVDFIKATESQDGSGELTVPGGRSFLATASSIFADDVRIGRIIILRDITEFKEINASKSVFVATVSHDLRSPLTMLRGYANMLEAAGELNKQQESYIRRIKTSAESMARLINNLLDLGRIESDQGLHLQTLPIQDIFEQVIDTLQKRANQKGVRIHFEPDKLFLPLIEADHALLQQAFSNLLDNAIKYSPDGQDVWIRAKSIQDKIIFEFEDQGIGISALDKPRLFEAFFRSTQREARRESGTGLGLAIVRLVAERHGGQVWVESQLGKGSTFYFEIPIRQHKDIGK